MRQASISAAVIANALAGGSYAVDGTSCPFCKAAFHRSSPAGKSLDQPPGPGTVVLCGNCAMPSIYGDQMQLKKISPGHWWMGFTAGDRAEVERTYAEARDLLKRKHRR